MGIKTIIGPKGVVSELVSGDDQVVTRVKQSTEVTVVAAGSGIDASDAPVVLMQPSSVGVTASLPGVSSANLGCEVLILTDGSTNPVLVSGSNGINGSVWTTVLNSAHDALRLMAVSSSADGLHWHIISQN